MLLTSSNPLSYRHFEDSVPDLEIVDCDGGRKPVHRLALARFSDMLASLLLEEDTVVLLPDVSPIVLDRILTLIYCGWVGGLDPDVVTHIRELCDLLHVGQDQFVVESDDKHLVNDARSKLHEEKYSIDENDIVDNVDANYCKDERNTIDQKYSIDENDLNENNEGEYCRDERSSVDQNSAIAAKDIVKDSDIKYCTDFKDTIEQYNMIDNVKETDVNDKDRDTDINCNGEKTLIEEGSPIEVKYKKIVDQLPLLGCFQCPKCDKYFTYLKSFERHAEFCQLGTKNQVRKSKLIINKKSPVNESGQVDKFTFVHYERADEDLLYRCLFPGCNYHQDGGLGFKTVGGCRNHQLLHHATESQKLFSCCYCDKRFASNQLRNKHQNLAHNKRFPCQSCGKVFSESTRLAIHSRTHSGEKPYVCEDCGLSFSQRDNLRLHKEFKHPTDGLMKRNFSCSYCSASFLTKSNLTRHMATHTDIKPFVCHECGKTFKDPWALRQHSFSHGPAKYPCEECDQRFTSPLYLSRHMVNRIGKKTPIGWSAAVEV